MDPDQPLSLKWKWGFFLSLTMIFLCLILLLIFRQYTMYSYQIQLREDHQERFERLIEDITRLNTPLEAADFVPAEVVGKDLPARSLLERTANDYIILRFFNQTQKLVYESQHFDYPLMPSSDQLSRHSIEGRIYLVGSSRIISNNGQELFGTLQYVVDSREEDVFFNQLTIFLRKCLLVGIAISTLLGNLLAHYLLKPLALVNDTFDSLEADTLTQARVLRRHTNDEWSALTLHVNKLLDQIERYVTGQKQFVEDVSHELRTPVAIVEGHLKMLNRWGKDDQQILEESIAASLQEITRMKGLIQEMLDLSRAENVDKDYKNEITEVVSSAQLVKNNFQVLYPHFFFNFDADLEQKIFVSIYRHHFEQILVILLDNAVKYSTDRLEVHLSISTRINRVQVAVQDFGEGMTETDKNRVFGRFYRVDKARSRAKGGNGLGLSIAKQLVESYGGRIRVESVYQRGSIFYLEFPLLITRDSNIK